MDMKKFMKILIFIAFSSLLYADIDANLKLFNKALKLYEKQKFEDALKVFSGLSETYKNWQIFYNIGNCYYRLGDLPRAHLYYLKAKRLNPRDKNINYNISVVREMLKLKKGEKGFIVRITEFFTKRELRFIIVVLNFILVLSAFIWISSRREFFFWLIPFSLIFLLFSAVILYTKCEFEKPGKWGVLVESASVLSGPSQTYKIIAEVPAGMDVEILEKEGDFALINLPTGQGWIEESKIAKVIK